MTIHFVNILSWQYFASKKNSNMYIYIDGFILVNALRAFEFYTKKQSGLVYYQKMDKSNIGYILRGPSTIKDSIVCPFWEKTNDVHITPEILSFVSKYDKIIIGISAPKQDELAILLNNEFPDKYYYCLGAALYTRPFNLSDSVFNTWISNLYVDPKRTLIKFYLSVKKVFKLMTRKSTRISFSKFISFKLIEGNSSCSIRHL